MARPVQRDVGLDLAIPSFTLDTNAVIDLDEHRPDEPHIRALVDAHAAGTARVAIVAISASENQKGDRVITNYAEFADRLVRLGLDQLDELFPMAYFGVAFFDHALFAGPDEIMTERAIHEVLFPDTPFDWTDYANAQSLPVDGDPDRDWRNKKCDVQMMWAHLRSGNDTFVTNDGNFHKPEKKGRLQALGVRDIKRPREAVALLPSRAD